MLTLAILQQLWPNGDSKIRGLRVAMATGAPTVFPNYGLTSDLCIAHAMAQFSHECNAGQAVEENLNYSAQGLIATWPNRFTAEQASAMAHDPQAIANYVYDGRNGNLLNSDDGWTFRGRGAIQVTGRGNYATLGQRVRLDLVNQPDLVLDAPNFLECAVAMFVILGCLPYAQNDDINGVTIKVNGGLNGLPDRQLWLTRWKAALGPP